jgi:internalin A
VNTLARGLAVVILSTSACGFDAPGAFGPLPQDPPEPGEGVEVRFPDPMLERAIRLRIGRASGPIFQSDLATLTKLKLSGKYITNLSGMEYLTSVHTLYLSGNSIWDVTPISGLTTLKELHLSGNNISNLEPLSQLIGLEYLRISGNPIEDFSPLGALTNLRDLYIMETPGLGEMTWLSELTELERLFLGYAPVSSIQSLTNLTNLRELYIPRANVDDVSPLRSLVLLNDLELRSNEISDLGPLVANHGLKYGDQIGIWGNPLTRQEACPLVQVLIDRGVTVDHDLDCG